MSKSLLTAAVVAASATSMAVAGSDAEALDAALVSTEKTFWDRFSFGTYGEIHSTFYKDGGTDIDPHRIVLFADFEITDKLKLVTETELEHAYRKKPGQNFTSSGVELKLEQAYLEYTFDNGIVGKGGLILAPVGRINEVHEPTTFYGVERPNVEKNIIPTTWTLLGAGVTKNVGEDWQLDGLFHGGNDTKGGSIRGGRSKYGIDLFTVNSEGNRFNQNTESWALTGRAKYNGFEKVNLAASVQYQSDMDSTVDGSQDGVLTEAHGIFSHGGFQFIALGSAWNIDVEGEGDNQWGYYLEPSYAWDTPIGKVGVFARYSQYQYANLKAGSTAKKNTEYNAGGNYWINENLVLKADYQTVSTKGKEGGTETYNFGFGWYY
ncbi:hypothetical protein [Rubritalea marina]|uniref:hypothetical protein n=1 Tax=Rubritalea marina TaxID=361055 RepID=UPI0003819401|nr:hypothetical protein [Rubritalea marina]